MAFDMVGGEEGFAQGHGEGFGEGGAHEECGGEAGASGGGDGVEVFGFDTCLGEGVVHDDGEAFQMGAAGELGHHAFEGGVFGVLRVEDIAEDLARGGIHHGGGGFIAAGFDGEDLHGWVLGVSLG